MGADLYNNLKEYLRKHLLSLLAESSGHSGEALLKFYTDKWNKYTLASMVVHHLFGYLNRHWVKREIDEGHKTIYEVYTVRCWRVFGRRPFLLTLSSRFRFPAPPISSSRWSPGATISSWPSRET